MHKKRRFRQLRPARAARITEVSENPTFRELVRFYSASHSPVRQSTIDHSVIQKWEVCLVRIQTLRSFPSDVTSCSSSTKLLPPFSRL
jgi:hypothetical protein